MSDRQDFVCLLTPPGAAAIAVLGVHGPKVWDVIAPLFRPFGTDALPDLPSPGQFWPGRIGEDAHEVVVLAVKKVQPIPWLEVHCHGGTELVRMLQDLFVSRSLDLCGWPEFLEQTGVPPWRIDAKEMLAQAPTVRTAAILLDQVHGAFRGAVEEIARGLEANEADSMQSLERMATLAALGRHLVAPFRVGIAGPPNVGKSSLINALAGYTRSIVSAIPGTTRDVVTARLAIDGWPVEIFDTAGLREAGEPLEREGMRLAHSALDQADLILWVFDGASGPIYPPTIWLAMLNVINKIDLPAAWDWSSADACRVSAQTNEGLTGLCQTIADRLVPARPRPGEGMPYSKETCAGVLEAAALARNARRHEAARSLLDLIQRPRSARSSNFASQPSR